MIGCYTDSTLWASVIDNQQDVAVPEEDLSCNDINTDLFKLDERTRLMLHLTVSRARTEAPMQDNMQNEHEWLNSDSQFAKSDSACDEDNKVLFNYR